MSGECYGENFEVDVNSWKEADAVHLWRYFNARGFIEEYDHVIDLGCGHGYGTDILSRSLAFALRGYDYDKRVLDKRAIPLYASNKVAFYHKDIEEEDIPKSDYVVCIEVLEHMKDPKALVRKMKESARRIIFVSIPIITTVGGPNKFHQQDFTSGDVEAMFADNEWATLKWANLGGENGLFLFYRKSWQRSN